jgi:hypothetical protein
VLQDYVFAAGGFLLGQHQKGVSDETAKYILTAMRVRSVDSRCDNLGFCSNIRSTLKPAAGREM